MCLGARLCLILVPIAQDGGSWGLAKYCYPHLTVHPQKSFYNLMTSDKKSERFFKVLHDRMKRAQQETKSTVAVNMSDLGSQPREDREPADPTAKSQDWGQGHREQGGNAGWSQRVQGESITGQG